LRYGENPHQKASWASDRTLPPWEIHQGKELSYTNLLDLDAALRIALEFPEPVGVVIKHTNPCGVALGATIAEAYVRAREADPLSAFGGIVGLNRPLDADTARALTSTFIEAVIAPAVADEARPILATKANLRVATTDFARLSALDSEYEQDARAFLGGTLLQDRDVVAEARAAWPHDDFPKVVTERAPTPEEWNALRFAWRVCGHVKSNAVIFTGADRTLAVGAGQMSRVDAVKVAVMKAAGMLTGSVAASDAFFPFADGLQVLIDAGVRAVAQPGGSVRDPELIEAAVASGITMYLTGVRHFLH
jgi:phosphoribosylaminoimidazolecarboxamide formyltransferase/IMP cyclohydrolase